MEKAFTTLRSLHSCFDSFPCSLVSLFFRLLIPSIHIPVPQLLGGPTWVSGIQNHLRRLGFFSPKTAKKMTELGKVELASWIELEKLYWTLALNTQRAHCGFIKIWLCVQFECKFKSFLTGTQVTDTRMEFNMANFEEKTCQALNQHG